LELEKDLAESVDAAKVLAPGEAEIELRACAVAACEGKMKSCFIF
jgi:hypothetical protein